jgi:hypothetical protein
MFNKFKIVPLVLALVLLSVPASVVSADVQQYPAQLEYYDAQINVMLPRLESFQAQYYDINGRYYQALQSHATAPAVPTVPDAITSSPTDQPEDLALFWSAFAELPETLSWSFRIDTYSGPSGDGYVVTVAAIIDDQLWMRAVHYGPAAESWRGFDWTQVTEE